VWTSKFNFAAIILAEFLASSDIASGAQLVRKLFTISDEIELSHFDSVEQPIRFSPDGSYFAVVSERGRLDTNEVEDCLRIYRAHEVEDLLKQSNRVPVPSPVWTLTLSAREGPVIKNWRWLADSAAVAFLERTSGVNYRLVLADLQSKTLKPLTSITESVTHFDVLDQRHYVFTAADPVERERKRMERQAPVIVGTGQALETFLLPDNSRTIRISPPPIYLWAVIDGKQSQVMDGNVPLKGGDTLALSPDGTSLVTTAQVGSVPLSWETLYPPPYPSDPYRIRPGDVVDQFVRINLQSGAVQSLTDAPVRNGLWAAGLGNPKWSKDGTAIVLPGTFLSSQAGIASRPCIAVVELPSNTGTCVEMLKGEAATGVEDGYHMVKEVSFVDGDKHRVLVSFYNHQDLSVQNTEYRQAADGKWQGVEHLEAQTETGNSNLRLTVRQSLNQPQQLVASDNRTSRVIWDPNPQLKDFALGVASVYTWKDKEGKPWRGGLYRPPDYRPSVRYPLVIQTHGFVESEFRPSGIYPTAFAARALTTAGMVVLQISENVCPVVTPNEGACAVAGYEAAVRQLVAENVVDPSRIGIIGFSRTCFYIMQMLTTSSISPKAASITDGVMETYFQYLETEKDGDQAIAQEADAMIGARPFEKGLLKWLQRSPGFNLDKIRTPLLVVGEGPVSLLFMWEPYAGLRYIHKPVDLMMLNTDEHVLTNPGVRMASQGGSVDWFRFWLQDYEDPDPAKKEQYERWRGLKKMQAENDKKAEPAAMN